MEYYRHIQKEEADLDALPWVEDMTLSEENTQLNGMIFLYDIHMCVWKYVRRIVKNGYIW